MNPSLLSMVALRVFLIIALPLFGTLSTGNVINGDDHSFAILLHINPLSCKCIFTQQSPGLWRLRVNSGVHRNSAEHRHDRPHSRGIARVAVLLLVKTAKGFTDHSSVQVQQSVSLEAMRQSLPTKRPQEHLSSLARGPLLSQRGSGRFPSLQTRGLASRGSGKLVCQEVRRFGGILRAIQGFCDSNSDGRAAVSSSGQDAHLLGSPSEYCLTRCLRY